MLTGCATIAPPQPPSLELPKPPRDLRAVRKGDKVTLTWSIPVATTDRQTVRALGPTRICRGVEPVLSQCGTAVGEAPASSTSSAPSGKKIESSYTDLLPSQIEGDDPSAFISYAVEVLNTDGRGAGLSNQVRVALARTPPPPQDLGVRVTNQGVVLTWTGNAPPANPQQPITYVYRVYRRQEGSPQQILAGELPETAGALSLTDSGIEWEKAYEYRVETVTVIAQANKPERRIEGEDSPVVKIFADDVFPPSVPSGLQAVYSGPGQKVFVDLVWAPVSDVDLDGYNVYRREEGTDPVKVNTELVKTPAYRDGSVVSGKNYLYSVSAVDVRGNESARSEEAGESVP
jgi:hypothetical protein